MENNNHEDNMQDIERWAQMWDKAQADGIFPAPKAQLPTPNTADHSFFGVLDTNQKELSNTDAQYWYDIYNTGNNMGHGFNMDDPNSGRESEEGILQEERQKVAPGQSVQHPASPNPIKTGTVGMDQDIHEPRSLDQTYSPIDLEELHDLKIKLHGLEDSLMSSEGLGESGAKFETQIASLKTQIAELSDLMGYVYDELPKYKQKDFPYTKKKN